MPNHALRECVSSGEDVSVNTVIIQRNWRAILADLRSEATEEASIAPQFWGMMTVFTDTSDPELMYSHCYNVNTTRFLDLWLLHMSILVLKYGSQEKVSFWCRCSIFLSPTFVEIKKSFTKMLLSLNFNNFRIFFSWKKTDKSEPM